MPDVHHVAVLCDVLLAFEAQCALGTSRSFGAGFEQRIPANRFGANEVMFQVRVNRAGGLRSFRANRDRPGAAFVFASRKKADQPLQLIALANQADETAFAQAVAAKKFRSFFVVHLGELGFLAARDVALIWFRPKS